MVVSTFFGITPIWDWNKSWPFPVLWPLLYFPNVLVYWVSTLTASSSRILNRSARIPPPLLALFILCFLRPIWLHNAGCLALGEWPHHRDYPGHQDFFSPVPLCILATSSLISSIPLLVPYHFFPLCAHLFAWNVPLVSPIFLKRPLVFSILRFSSISLLKKPFLYLSLLYFGTLHSEGHIFPWPLHSDGHIFPFLFCLSLLFFPNLFVRPPQATIFCGASLFLEDGFCNYHLYNAIYWAWRMGTITI